MTQRWITTWVRERDGEHARMHDTREVAVSECVNWDRMFGVGTCRLLVVDLEELPELGANADEQYQFAERQMIRWATEHGRLADLVHGREMDKRDRDYHVRVKRNAEWKAHTTTELRQLLEMFKPPDLAIEVRRDVHVGGRWEQDKDGKFYQHADRVWPFVVGVDNIFTTGETEGAAYAAMLEHLLAGRGFYPGT